MVSRQKFIQYTNKYGSLKDGVSRRIRGNKIFRLHLLATWAAEIVRHPALVSVVSKCLGCQDSGLLVWSSDLAIKPGGSSDCFGWHQDEAYADLQPHYKLLTAWVALSPSNSYNGCVRVIEGSNNCGTLPHISEERTAERNLVLCQVLPQGVEPPGERVSLEMETGDCSLHAWRTVHSSLPNTSDTDRDLLSDIWLLT